MNKPIPIKQLTEIAERIKLENLGRHMRPGQKFFAANPAESGFDVDAHQIMDDLIFTAAVGPRGWVLEFTGTIQL